MATLEQLTALESAYYQGATKVKYADKEVNYMSRADMKQIIDEMREELGLTSTAVPRRRTTIHTKGLS